MLAGALTKAVQLNASVASTGLGIRYIGQKPMFAYCLSGVSNPSSGPTTYLLFTTGTGFIVGRFEFNANFAGAGGNDLKVEIYFNAIKIVEENDIANNYLAGDSHFDVLIPPQTAVQVDLSGSSAATNINFVGRVYGAE